MKMLSFIWSVVRKFIDKSKVFIFHAMRTDVKRMWDERCTHVRLAKYAFSYFIKSRTITVFKAKPNNSLAETG